MTSDNLSALIARLEAATGPDRELDALIGVAVQRMQGPGRHGVHPVYKENTARFADDGEVLGHCPASPYTASIDAAITLIPGECKWSLFGGGYASVEHWDGIEECTLDCAQAATPALALCLASLRARMTTTAPTGEHTTT